MSTFVSYQPKHRFSEGPTWIIITECFCLLSSLLYYSVRCWAPRAFPGTTQRIYVDLQDESPDHVVGITVSYLLVSNKPSRTSQRYLIQVRISLSIPGPNQNRTSSTSSHGQSTHARLLRSTTEATLSFVPNRTNSRTTFGDISIAHPIRRTSVFPFPFLSHKSKRKAMEPLSSCRAYETIRLEIGLSSLLTDTLLIKSTHARRKEGRPQY